LLLHLTRDGALAIDTSDQIQAGVVIAHDGRVVHQGVAGLLQREGGAGVDGTAD
jgi:NAD(P) transhydrogenase subunit alpha